MHYEKMDKYDYLIGMAALDVVDADVQYFKSLDVSDVEVSDRLTRRVMRMIRRNGRAILPSPAQVGRALSRVAIVVLITVSVMFAAMMSITAVRTAVWEAVIEWYDTYMRVYFAPDAPTAVEPPSTIEQIRRPTLLPLGAEEEVLRSNALGHMAEYYIGDTCCLAYTQNLMQSGMDLDGEEVGLQTVQVHTYSATLTEKDGGLNLMWSDGAYRYTLCGFELPLETLIAIAESVQ